MLSAKVVSVEVDPHAAEDFLKILDEGLTDVAEAIFTRSQELVAVDEGMLKKSGHVEDAYLEKDVVYDAPQSVFVEFGTDPHMPPFQPIRDWVHRKRADLGVKPADVDKVAKAIQWKIYQHGTEAQPYLRPAFDEVEVRAAEIIRAKFKE